MRGITGRSEMRYVTAIFYTKEGKNKVIYSENFGKTPIEASNESKAYCEIIKKQAKSDKEVKNISFRTFEIDVPSYDLR